VAKGRKAVKSKSSEPNEYYSANVEILFDEFVPTLELIFGKKLPKDKRREIEEKLSELRTPSIQYARRVEEWKKTGDMAQFAKISNDFMKELMPEVPSGVSGLEYVLETLFKPSRAGIPYIEKSKYSDYMKIIQEIISITTSGGFKNVSFYMSSVDNVESDNLAWAQSLTTDMPKVIKFLTPDRKRFSVKLATRCISEYSKMSGVYERLIVIIAGFISITPDAAANYKEFRKKGLSKSIDVIKNKGWGILTQEFDVLMRNSIAHKSYVINPNTRLVDFTDPISGKTESISYQVLFERTRGLSSLVLALSQFRGIVARAILFYLNPLIVENKE